jgi:hypothetical protein
MHGDWLGVHYRPSTLAFGGQVPTHSHQLYRKRRSESRCRFRRVSTRWEHTQELELRESMRWLYLFGLPCGLTVPFLVNCMVGGFLPASVRIHLGREGHTCIANEEAQDSPKKYLTGDTTGVRWG